LTANVGENVAWFINGAPQAPQRDGHYRWALTPGAWSVRAIGPDGAAETTFTVE
jgi:hypothetical protein